MCIAMWSTQRKPSEIASEVYVFLRAWSVSCCLEKLFIFLHSFSFTPMSNFFFFDFFFFLKAKVWCNFEKFQIYWKASAASIRFSSKMIKLTDSVDQHWLDEMCCFVLYQWKSTVYIYIFDLEKNNKNWYFNWIFSFFCFISIRKLIK